VWLSDASVPVWLLHSQFPAHCTGYVLQHAVEGKSIDLSIKSVIMATHTVTCVLTIII
jgi:hypothetical protein